MDLIGNHLYQMKVDLIMDQFSKLTLGEVDTKGSHISKDGKNP